MIVVGHHNGKEYNYMAHICVDSLATFANL